MPRLTLRTTLLLFAISLFSCSKPKAAASYLDKDFKSYFDYQLGSYWIMYDSINGHTDSFVVSTYADLYPGVNTTDNKEAIEILIMEYDKDSPTDSLLWDISLATPHYSFLHSGATSSIPAENYNFVQQMPFDVTTNVSLIPTYSSGGISYSSVYKINLLPQNNDFFFVNSDYGFVKILLNDQYLHKSMYLLRHKIIR